MEQQVLEEPVPRVTPVWARSPRRSFGEPRRVGVEGVGPAKEVLDEVSGVATAARSEHLLPVRSGHLGVEQVVAVEAENMSLAMTSDHMYV